MNREIKYLVYTNTKYFAYLQWFDL